LPVTVAVKVVSDVIAGVVVDPPLVGVTVLMPWSILMKSAFDVVHVSVEFSPESTDVGEAERVQLGPLPCGVIVTVTAQCATSPASLVAVPV